MNFEQDLTQKERVDDAILARLLKDARQNPAEEAVGFRMPAEDEKEVLTPIQNAAEQHGACGCGCCDGGEDCTGARVCAFGVENGVLAALYVPLQKFDQLYDMDTALRRGTLYKDLDKPFYGSGREVNCRGQYV